MQKILDKKDYTNIALNFCELCLYSYFIQNDQAYCQYFEQIACQGIVQSASCKECVENEGICQEFVSRNRQPIYKQDRLDSIIKHT